VVTVRKHGEAGVSLVEVLIAMVILAIGLLGLVGLQGRMHMTQVESYQRAQALMLLGDMGNRIALNRNNALSYVTTDPLGVNNACPTGGTSRVTRDLQEWCEALQGAAESLNGTAVGALVGGRGCIDQILPGEFMVTVAWQGMGPIAAPPATVTCGAGLYDGTGKSPCVNDLCRRAVTTLVRISDLTS
jgi:type IV pilus assembly protein PilV